MRCKGPSHMGMALHRYSVGCRWVSSCKTLATMLVYQPSRHCVDGQGIWKMVLREGVRFSIFEEIQRMPVFAARSSW